MNKLQKFLLKLGGMISISVCWCLCSLPVITLGASTAALFSAAYELREEQFQPVKVFFKAFVKKFRTATAIWFLFACAVAAVYLAVQILGLLGLQMLTAVTVGAATAALLLVCWVGICAFPMIAYFDNTVKKTVRNAAFVAFHHRKQSIGGALAVAAPVLLFLILPKYFFMAAALWILVYPGVAAYFVACRFAPILLEYDNRRKEKGQENANETH